ncbi:hypothetical protein COCON_G00115240 [Conger conger]|uniref:ADAMTS-like protein 1 n=1 Tax=Conger conger TaxID=82655 RepID=A0A9Q1HY79_CONCO|nr:hypothetical protein COCON_G00115240 [Conger conger]
MDRPTSAALLLLAAAVLLSSRTARSEEDRDTLWDAWGSWSECSRTCGGGASYSLRRCLSSKTCEGQNIKYKTCSNVDCPPGSGDFRAQQCSAHVDVRYQGRFHEWLPLDNDPENPCALKCKAKGAGLVLELAPKVLDGTRCYTESLDMCISGVCQIVGCDLELGSAAKEDNCGVCNGDGSSCRLVRGHYKSQHAAGKNEDTVIVIPYGSRHVRLVLKGLDHLYLESKTLPGVKGENSLGVPGTHHLENTTVDFQKFPDKEVLRIMGPLGADFTIKIRYNGGVDSVVQFIFYQPIIHRWRETDFFPCSVTCGGGYQLTSAECFDLRSSRVVVDQYCHYYPENIKPKPKLQECNQDPCPASDGYKQIMPYDLYHPLPRWESSPWTACSTSCGGGIQSRSVSCVEEDMQGVITHADEWKCLYSPKMAVLQACNTFDCPTWLAQEWSPCTVTCGQGLRYRVVLCIDYRGLHAGGCNSKTKPHIKEECLVTVPCYKPIEKLPVEAKPPWFKQAQELDELTAVTEEPTFIPGAWSPCSRTCGAGTQSRTVRCQVLLSFSQTVADLQEDECEGPKPAESQPCYRRPCRGEGGEWEEEEEEEEETEGDRPVEREELHDWEYEGFTECSESCGGGVQEAVVVCVNKQTQERSSEESLCVSSRRPPQLLRTCNTEPCPPRWETAAWSSCSATCGVGLMSRAVSCTHLQSREDNRTVTVSDGKCRLPKPSPVQACNRFDCPPMWELKDWAQCSRSCGGGMKRREALCKQRLADGSVLELPDTFCPSPSPPTLQPCEKRECPPRWVPTEWSQCSATCGEGTQKLALVCRKQEENGEHRTLAQEACAPVPQPVTVRACSLGACTKNFRPGGTKLGPSILAQRKVYIQWRKEKKLQLVMGGYAYLLPRTSVFIRCPVRRFRKGQIRWLKDGKALLSQPHLLVTPLGYIKIQHLRASHAGVYACAAGQAQENLVLKVIGSKRKLPVPDGSLWLTEAEGKAPPEDLRLSFGKYDAIVQRLLELKGAAREGPDSRELLDSAEKNASTLEEDSAGEAWVSQTLVTETWRLDEIVRNLSLHPRDQQTLHSDQLLTQLLVELSKNHGESNESTLLHPGRPATESFTQSSKAGPDATKSGGSTGTHRELSRAPAILQKTLSLDKEQSPLEIVAQVGTPVFLPRQTISLELRCEAAGTPEPVITWTKDGVELVYSSRVGRLPGGSLRILAPREADVGLYTCTARNRAGSTSLSSSLRIAEPPEPSPDDPLWTALAHAAEPGVHVLLMTGNYTKTTLQSGTTALIGCPVRGYPTPKVSWFLNRQPLSQTAGVPHQLLAGDQALHLPNITRTLRGEVSCSAENKAGALQQRKVLDVQGVKAPGLKCLVDGVEGNHSLCRDKKNTTQRTVACQGQHCPLRWQASAWSPCSVNCGGGVQVRRVYCQQGSQEEDSCVGAGRKPPDTQLCNAMPCVEWAASAWGQCNGRCVGPRLATQHRQMFCQDRNGTRVHQAECGSLPRPGSYRNCSADACAVQWRPGPWTQCTSTCGSHGFQARRVPCVHQRSGRSAREANCAWRTRPPTWQRCNIQPCAREECRDSTRYCEKVRQLELCSMAQFKARCCESCRSS